MKVATIALVLLLSGISISCVPAAKHSTGMSTKSRMIAEPRARVVFVHGIFQHGGVSFGSLRHRLEDQGIACFAPTLKPSDARYGMEDLARQLKEGIDREFGPHERITIVGFSLGGLVARYYLQEMGGAQRCEALYTVATPHRGTHAAWFYFGKGSRQLLPGSEFLRHLDATAERLGDMPVVAYRSPYDVAILPTHYAAWARGENFTAPVLIHPMLTRSKPVIEDIERRVLDALPPEPKGPAAGTHE